MSGRKTFKSADEYMEHLAPKAKSKLQKLRACIYKAAPDAFELINYNIPAYAMVPGGKRDQQVMIAGYENHVGLYPGADTIEHFAKLLQQYKQGRGSVQFPLDEALPEKLIIEMVEYKQKQVIDALPNKL